MFLYTNNSPSYFAFLNLMGSKEEVSKRKKIKRTEKWQKFFLVLKNTTIK